MYAMFHLFENEGHLFWLALAATLMLLSSHTFYKGLTPDNLLLFFFQPISFDDRTARAGRME